MVVLVDAIMDAADALAVALLVLVVVQAAHLVVVAAVTGV